MTDPGAGAGAVAAGAPGEPAEPVADPVAAGAPGEPAEPAPATSVPADEVPPAFRVASLVSVGIDLPTEHPAVVLRETEIPRRQLTFSVRLSDGILLSHVLRRIPTPRPLTPELLADVLRSFEIDVVATRLVGRTGAVYFAELDLRSRQGRAVLSCRPTDGIAAALLQPVAAPILIDERLLEGPGDVEPG